MKWLLIQKNSNVTVALSLNTKIPNRVNRTHARQERLLKSSQIAYYWTFFNKFLGAIPKRSKDFNVAYRIVRKTFFFDGMIPWEIISHNFFTVNCTCSLLPLYIINNNLTLATPTPGCWMERAKGKFGSHNWHNAQKTQSQSKTSKYRNKGNNQKKT